MRWLGAAWLAAALAVVACGRHRSRAVPGDACPTAPSTFQLGGTCSEDGRSVLDCSEGRYFVRATCDGPAGCKRSTLTSGDASFPTISCDVAAASPGKACVGIAAACAADGRAVSACLMGTFQDLVPCRGPKGCHGDFCDQSIARPGETCWYGFYDDACSEDGQRMLRCAGRTRSVVFACKGPVGCLAEGASDGKGILARAFCDQSVADVGDPCAADGYAACSGDGKSLLTCKGGTFERTATCVGEPCKREQGKAKCRKAP